MKVLTEDDAARLVTMTDAIGVVENVFVRLAQKGAATFPVLIGQGTDPASRFAVKSGIIHSSRALGLKIGTYWPANRSKGIESHASTTILLDDQTGFAKGVVGATYLTALRTAAADAVAVRALSRPDASVLGVVGAGHQAYYEIAAISLVRPITRVKVWNRTAENGKRLMLRIEEILNLPCTVHDLDDVVSTSDIITTVTSASQPIVRAEWVKAGTHISAMGADNPGKQEIDHSRIKSWKVFADMPEQSAAIGELQRAVASGLISLEEITSLGDVLLKGKPGRSQDSDVTLFDSSGVALQDIAIASLALQKAERNVGTI